MVYHMSYAKEKPSKNIPYGEIITRILRTFKINILREKSMAPNNRIDYTSLRDMKINVKYEEMRDEWTYEEEETKKSEEIDIKKVWKILQNIARYMNVMKEMISR